MTTLHVAPERWLFGGVNLSTYACLVRQVTGADEFAPLRGEDAPLAGLPGRRFLAKLEDSRRIALGLWILPLAADGERDEPTDPEQVRANLDALYAVLGRRTEQELVRVMPDGSERTALAEVVEVGSIEDPANGALIGLVVDFLLADPFFYGPDEEDSRAIATSPTSFTLNHPGTQRTHRVRFEFTGPITNPRVTNETTGVYVEWLSAVADGKHLVIDAEAFTAVYDGTASPGYLAHSGAYEFMNLDPGENAIAVTGTGLGANSHISTTFRPAYR